MRAAALAFATLFLLGTNTFAQTEVMRATEVTADQVGEEIAVEGRVYSNAKEESGAIHLYFGADTTSAFRAIVPSGDLHKFKVDVQTKYTKRNVRVTGKVEEQNSTYYILIREPKQIKVVPRKRGTN